MGNESECPACPQNLSECMDTSKDECYLKPNSTINNKKIGEDITSSNDKCAMNCKYVFTGSKASICKDVNSTSGIVAENKCMCTIVPPDTNQCDITESYYMCGNEKAKTKSDQLSNNNNYFNSGKFIKKCIIDNTIKINDIDNYRKIICGCDSIYNKYVTNKNINNKVLEEIWTESITKTLNTNSDNKNNYKSLYDNFKKSLPISSDDLKDLIAYEMCRLTNTKLNRNKQINSEKNVLNWFKYNFSSERDDIQYSNNYTTLTWISRVMVWVILIFLLIKTLFPDNEPFKSVEKSFSSSLFYALCMPKLFSRLNSVTLNTLFVFGLIFAFFVILLLINAFTKDGDNNYAIFNSINNYYIPPSPRFVLENGQFNTKLLFNGYFITICAIFVGSLIYKCKRSGCHITAFILITIFGVVPFAAWLIFFMFVVTYYSPGISLFFIFAYRFMNVFFNIKNLSFIPKIFGKRNVDKWVFPFLPIIIHFVKFFHMISGEDKPDYLLKSYVLKHATNTGLFFS